MAELHEILSLSEAAELAGVSPGRLRQLIDVGRLRAKKIGNSWAILARDLDSFLGKRQGSGRPDERHALASRIFVDLRSNSPFHIQLSGQVPDIRLWFKADNRSSLEVELDRLFVDIWFGQPVTEGWVLNRVLLPPNEWNETVMFHQYLTRDQADMVRERANDSQTSTTFLRLQLIAHFNTPLGSIAVHHIVERQKGEVPIYS